MSRRRRQRLLVIAAAILLVTVVLAWQHWRANAVPRWLERHDEETLLPLIDEVSARHGVAPALVRAVIWKESRFNQFSVGKKGEVGLMQITGGAVQDWARRTKSELPSRFDLFVPEINLEIGTWYLGQAVRHWQGCASMELLALAEYNAGYKKVRDDWAPQDPGTPVPLSAITYPGTRQYVQKILERRRLYEEADAAATR